MSVGLRRLAVVTETETLPTAERATAVLRRLVGRGDATFRDGQLDAITALVDDRSRVRDLARAAAEQLPRHRTVLHSRPLVWSNGFPREL